jgi:hypothetical protein
MGCDMSEPQQPQFILMHEQCGFYDEATGTRFVGVREVVAGATARGLDVHAHDLSGYSGIFTAMLEVRGGEDQVASAIAEVLKVECQPGQYSNLDSSNAAFALEQDIYLVSSDESVVVQYTVSAQSIRRDLFDSDRFVFGADVF